MSFILINGVTSQCEFLTVHFVCITVSQLQSFPFSSLLTAAGFGSSPKGRLVNARERPPLGGRGDTDKRLSVIRRQKRVVVPKTRSKPLMARHPKRCHCKPPMHHVAFSGSIRVPGVRQAPAFALVLLLCAPSHHSSAQSIMFSIFHRFKFQTPFFYAYHVIII